jgi:hypothetical protein
VLGVSDLFIVGLGLDLSGAILLAAGLLAPTSELVKRDMTY